MSAVPPPPPPPPPDGAAQIQSALQALGGAFVLLGNAILAIDSRSGGVLLDAGAPAGGKGKKRKVKDKADRKPRAPSAYNNFVKAEGSKLQAEGKTQQDVMRELGTMWRGLSEQQRVKYKPGDVEPAADTDSDDDVAAKRARNDSDDKKKDSSDEEPAQEKKDKDKKKKKKKKKDKKEKSSSSSGSDSEE